MAAVMADWTVEQKAAKTAAQRAGMTAVPMVVKTAEWTVGRKAAMKAEWWVELLAAMMAA